MSSSSSEDSSSGASDFDLPAVAVPAVRKRRNIDLVEPVEGEANLKGFVSAFATIMDRKDVVPLEVAVPTVTVPVAKKQITVLSCHNKTPLIVSPTEEAFESTAKRGVMKLFKAMSMHRKKTVRVERRRNKPVELTGTVGAASMTSFLELLKAQKVKK